MKRIMIYTAVILATLVTLYVLWQFRLVVLLFVLSLFAAAMIRPFIARLTFRGLPGAAAQLLVYVVAIGGLLILLLLLGDLLVGEVNSVVNKSIIAYEAFHNGWRDGLAWQQAIAANLPQPFSLDGANELAFEEMLPAVMNITASLARVIGGLIIVLALSLYWSVDQHHFERLWLSALPAKRRAYARDSWREIERVVGVYLRSQTAQSVLAALALGAGAVIGGFRYPILLALFGALAAFVPLFGGLLAALVAFSLGSLETTWLGLAWALYTLVVFLALEFLVEPRLWRQERRYYVLTILVVIPMLHSFGLWGLLAAPILAATLEVLIRHAFRIVRARRDTSVRLEELTDRLQQHLHHTTEAEEEDMPPELQSLAERLAALLAEAQALNSR